MAAGSSSATSTSPAGGWKKRLTWWCLSVGLGVSQSAVELANRMNVALDPYQFVVYQQLCAGPNLGPRHLMSAAPVEAPKDIPSSVIESSAAAGIAGSSLIESRWTLTKKKEIPAQTDTRGESPRIGVFVCHCGTNIGGVVDVPGVVEFARTLPYVVYAEENMFSCSQDTQNNMAKLIKEKNSEPHCGGGLHAQNP